MPKYQRPWRMQQALNAFRTMTPYARRLGSSVFNTWRARAAARAGSYGMSDTASTARTRSGQGVTIQKDSKLIYKRKRAPRKVRRRARKAYKRAIAMQMKLTGTRTILANRVISLSAAGGFQIFDSFVLFGGWQSAYGNASSRGYDDMKELLYKDYLAQDTTGDAEKRWSSGAVKVYIDSAVMDVTIQNQSVDGELNNGVGCELDIYEFSCRKFDFAATVHEGYDTAISQAPPQGSGLSALVKEMRGFTPFDAPEAIKLMGIKIWKKTKYFVPYGDPVTYQMRVSKNIRINSSDILTNQDSTTNHTRGILIVAKVLPNDATDGVCRLDVGMTRKYKYKIFEPNTTRGGYASLI